MSARNASRPGRQAGTRSRRSTTPPNDANTGGTRAVQTCRQYAAPPPLQARLDQLLCRRRGSRNKLHAGHRRRNDLQRAGRHRGESALLAGMPFDSPTSTLWPRRLAFDRDVRRHLTQSQSVVNRLGGQVCDRVPGERASACPVRHPLRPDPHRGPATDARITVLNVGLVAPAVLSDLLRCGPPLPRLSRSSCASVRAITMRVKFCPANLSSGSRFRMIVGAPMARTADAALLAGVALQTGLLDRRGALDNKVFGRRSHSQVPVQQRFRRRWCQIPPPRPRPSTGPRPSTFE